MSKFSVKKPFTVFVAVIAVLVLGVVAFLKMTPDLLPNMDFPYVMIMTTYPGASPEKVEEEITKPMEQAMSTLEHIVEVSSTSSENYSMVMLEFEESVNMDTIGVDIQQEISALSANWDDMVGTPYVLKINPSMLPIQVAAVSMDGMDTIALTEFLNETLMNKLEGIAGVARITTSGAVEQELHVILDQEKIDALNQTIADAINNQLDEAEQELEDQKQDLVDAQDQLEAAQDQLSSGRQELADQTAAGEAELQAQLAQLNEARQQLYATLTALQAVQSGLAELDNQKAKLYAQLDEMKAIEQEAITLQANRTQKELEINADSTLTPEQKQEKLTALEVEYNAAMAQLEVRAAVYGMTVADLPTQIPVIEANLATLEGQIAAMEATLAEQGITREGLGSSITEMQTTLSQLDEGITQLNDASVELSKTKTATILQLSQAATELAVSNSSITMALTQIESGFDTIQTSRDQALRSADLNSIITMDMVSGILTAQNFAMPAGYVAQDGINYMVSVGEEITEVEQLEDLLLFDLGMEDIEPIYLSDVAAIMLTDNRDETYAKLNGADSLVLNFEKQSTYATAEATDNITARFRELEEEYPGLQFVALMNQGDYIYMIVEGIISSLLLGAVFAVVILFLFLKDIRPTFITLCSIPISVIFAIVLMYFSGVTINMISLSGLAVSVGMLVDNSVVVIENIYRLRAKGANAIQAAVSGAGQVAGAVTASTLTTVCVFLPIVFVEGVTRQLFTDLALTMSYSLLASLIVSLTLVPAMASGMLTKEKEQKQKAMDKFLAIYGKMIGWALDHKVIVLALAVILVATSAWMSISKGFSFMPAMDMPNLNVNISMPEDTTMEEARELADQVLERIDQVEGIATVGAMMSSSSTSTEQSFDVTVYITLADEKGSGAAVGKQIVEACEDLPCTVSSSSAMLDMSMLSGSGISMRIYAEDMQTLQDAAKTAANVLGGVDGVWQVSDGLEDAAPALHVDIDRNEAMSKGMTVAQIYMEIASALTNTTVSAALEIEGTSTDVIIQRPEGTTLTADDLEDMEFTVEKQTGETVTFTLGDVAEVRHTSSLAAIERLGQRRYLTVTATLDEGYNVTLVTTAAERAMRNVDLGEGVSYVFSGENETIMEAVEQLGLMLVLGILLVYLVMVAQFQSLKSPFIVMFTIPLAFTGGFFALVLCNMDVSVISLIGFVMLTGIIVNNGIVLVDYINQLRLEGVDRRTAIVEAGQTRMRPILMTTVTTILGLIDMATNKSAATAVMQPIAIVCIGGLLYATLMTLFVVPCIYDIMNKKELRNVREDDLKLLDL